MSPDDLQELVCVATRVSSAEDSLKAFATADFLAHADSKEHILHGADIVAASADDVNRQSLAGLVFDLTQVSLAWDAFVLLLISGLTRAEDSADHATDQSQQSKLLDR